MAECWLLMVFGGFSGSSRRIRRRRRRRRRQRRKYKQNTNVASTGLYFVTTSTMLVAVYLNESSNRSTLFSSYRYARWRTVVFIRGRRRIWIRYFCIVCVSIRFFYYYYVEEYLMGYKKATLPSIAICSAWYIDKYYLQCGVIALHPRSPSGRLWLFIGCIDFDAKLFYCRQRRWRRWATRCIIKMPSLFDCSFDSSSYLYLRCS